jgi:hypothetical protein
MVVMAVFLLLCVIGFGVYFFRLISLPEQIARKTKKMQFEIVAILGLIGLFTQNYYFWVAGLILAFIEFPDFGTVLKRIADSMQRIAGKPPETAAKALDTRAETKHPDEAPGAALEPSIFRQADGHTRGQERSTTRGRAKEELSHT